MTKKEKTPKVGEVWLVDSFANVKVKKRITRKDEEGSGWFGVLIDEADAKALRAMSVPYIEIEKEETYVFNFHLIKRLKAVPRKKKNGSTSNRKHRRKRSPRTT
tara:strand:- start:139 stop:450 length:312 start_codon:yes stop_codon:yes gene_type:complete